MNSSDFRAEARRRLSGKWGKAALITLASFVTSFVIGFISGLFPDSLESLLSLVFTIIEIPLSFGLLFAFLKLFNNEEVKAFDFISLGFNNFKKAWGVSFRILLKIIVPIILFVAACLILLGASIYMSAVSMISSSETSLVGFLILTIIAYIIFIIGMVWAIVKSYSYQLSPLIAMENPEMSSKDAVLKSEKLMKGKRSKFFVLQFTFIGWVILAAIPFYIGYFWLIPYFQMATIAFYKFAIGDTSADNNDPIQ